MNLKPIEIILILAVILLLFGAKRLPDAARGLGRSLRIFKSEIKAAQDDEGNTPPQEIKATKDEVVDTTHVEPPKTPVETPKTETTER
jgi:sec-independent protein translocase protein TatA